MIGILFFIGIAVWLMAAIFLSVRIPRWVGNDDANTLTGTDNKLQDRLYGGAGNDTLDGKGGNDYLEGGSGADTYQFSGTWGSDAILDSDGNGTLGIDGDAQAAGKAIGDNLWQSEDKQWLYVLNTRDELVISNVGNAIHGYGGYDALPGSSGKDDIFGDEGDDLIGGGAGSDKIRGGDGNDFISSSATLNVQARLRPNDNWNAPAGKEVLTQGARWGIYMEFALKSIAISAYFMGARGYFCIKPLVMNESKWRTAA